MERNGGGNQGAPVEKKGSKAKKWRIPRRKSKGEKKGRGAGFGVWKGQLEHERSLKGGGGTGETGRTK